MGEGGGGQGTFGVNDQSGAEAEGEPSIASHSALCNGDHLKTSTSHLHIRSVLSTLIHKDKKTSSIRSQIIPGTTSAKDLLPTLPNAEASCCSTQPNRARRSTVSPSLLQGVLSPTAEQKSLPTIRSSLSRSTRPPSPSHTNAPKRGCRKPTSHPYSGTLPLEPPAITKTIDQQEPT